MPELLDHVIDRLTGQFGKLALPFCDILLAPRLIVDLPDGIGILVDVPEIDRPELHVRPTLDPVGDPDQSLRQFIGEIELVAPVIIELFSAGVLKQLSVPGRMVEHPVDWRFIKVLNQQAPVVVILSKIDGTTKCMVSSPAMPDPGIVDHRIGNLLVTDHLDKAEPCHWWIIDLIFLPIIHQGKAGDHIISVLDQEPFTLTMSKKRVRILVENRFDLEAERRYPVRIIPVDLERQLMKPVDILSCRDFSY